MALPNLEETRQKFAAWQANNGGEGYIPRHLKREAVALVQFYTRSKVARELSITPTMLRGWCRRYLEDPRFAHVFETGPDEPARPAAKSSAAFVELAPSADLAAGKSAPSLMLRRPDGGILQVRGELSTEQIRNLTRVFLGKGRKS